MMRARLAALLLAGAIGCGGGDGRGDGGIELADAGVGDAGCVPVKTGTLDPTLVATGAALVQANNCQQCHGAGLSGNFDGVMFPGHSMPAYPPNLTPDPDTGLGCWSDDQIVNAILNGVDDVGQPLCPPMPHFSSQGLSMADAIALATFLRSLEPQKNQVPTGPTCQPWGQLGGGCNATSDCPSGAVCLYQLCSAAGADAGLVADMARPGDMATHKKSGDMATAPGGCATSSIAIVAPSAPAIAYASVPLSVNVVYAGGCKPSSETFHWSFVTIPAGSKSAFNEADVADPSFVADAPNGSWRVHLTYGNGSSGQTLDAEAQVRSNGCFAAPPIAWIQTYLPSVSTPIAEPTPFTPSDAGPFGAPDLSFAVATGVQLSALASYDPATGASCGNVPPLQYAWTLVDEPPGATAHLSAGSGPTTNLTLDAAGRYVVGLSASDGYATSAPAYIRIDAR